MAKNRRKLIDGVKRALATLPAGATDRDFRPLLNFVLAENPESTRAAGPRKAKPAGQTLPLSQ